MDENKYEINQNSRVAKTLSVRVVFGFIGVVSLATAVFGMINVSQQIMSPAREQELLREEIASTDTYSGSLDEDMVLKNLDTDGDGISNYDELNVYGTSPYLADSDSDGFSDIEEISSGNDPNCPSGSDCRLGIPAEDVPGMDDFMSDDVLSDPSLPDSPFQGFDSMNLSADDIRLIILNSGEIRKEELDAIDDETIMEIYQEIIKSDQNQ